jgi:hypothetical protein
MTNNAKVARITDGSAMPPKLLLRRALLAGYSRAWAGGSAIVTAASMTARTCNAM